MTLQIGEFVFVAGRIGFSKGTRVTGMKLADRTGTAAGDLDLITVTATGVNIFVGIGGPYWNDSNGDQVINGSDDPLAAGAKGLILSNVNLAIALLKPTAANSRKSYFAMKVTGNASIVGIDGLGFSATGLSVEVNSASDPTAAAGTLPPVLNFQDKPLTVGSTIFNRANRFLGIHATVELTVSAVSIGATMDFEQTTRQNGTKVIKVALTNVDFVIGDPDDPTIEILDAEGLIFVTNLGMAAEFTVPVEFGDPDEGFYFDGDLVVGINNTDQPVNEVFIVDQDRLDNDDDGTIDEAGESVTLNLQKGPYLKLAGNDITVQIDDFERHRRLPVRDDHPGHDQAHPRRHAARRRVVRGPGLRWPDARQRLRRASCSTRPVPAGPAGGVAGQLQGTFTVTATGAAFQAQATVILQINTTELDPAAATIVMENGQISFSIPRKTFAVTIRDLDVRIGDFFTLKGDFTTRTVTDALGERVIYGAAQRDDLPRRRPVPAGRQHRQPGRGRRRRQERQGRRRQVHAGHRRPSRRQVRDLRLRHGRAGRLPGPDRDRHPARAHEQHGQGRQRDHQAAGRRAAPDDPGPVRLQHAHRGVRGRRRRRTAASTRTRS